MENDLKALRAICYSIALNSALAISKGVAGFFGNSHALIADAIESGTDILSSLLVFLGINYASRPADSNHPYGHGRAEPLITFIVVGFLIAAAIVIAYQSVRNILIPHPMPEPFTLIVLGLIILWKEASYQWMMRQGRETNSSALVADAWHHRSDALTSVAAFIGITVALIGGEQYASADDWAALVASGFILYNSYLIFRPALGEIMDEHLYDELVQEIRKVSVQVEGIMGTEKCFIRKAGMKYHVELHASVDGQISVQQGHHLAHVLKDKLRSELPQLGHVLIHIEPHEDTRI